MHHSHHVIHRCALLVIFLVFVFTIVSPDLGLATDLKIYGGLGGNEFRAECPKGSYLVGLQGRTGAWVEPKKKP